MRVKIFWKSDTVKSGMERIIDSKMYDLPELLDVSLADSPESNPQDVPDLSDEGKPHAKNPLTSTKRSEFSK